MLHVFLSLPVSAEFDAEEILGSILDAIEEEDFLDAQLDSLQHAVPEPEKATKEEIRSLSRTQKTTHTKKERGHCTVCLSEIKRGQRKFKLKCGHEFHTKCLNKSLKLCNKNCPVCRASVF